MEKNPEDSITQSPEGFLLDEGIVNEETIKLSKEQVVPTFHAIKNVLDKYLDMTKENQTIIATWILGTYLHKEFSTFPFLFINAMKGSGKTRLLGLIEALTYNGKLTSFMTEAVLFRTAETHTILIDEFEAIGSKEKSALRELLNSAYKKGTKIERIKKINTKEGEERVVEQFKMYTPIAIANIWGMEEVLGDRCIPIILDKSNNPEKTKIIEDYEDDMDIYLIKRTLDQIKCSLCNVVTVNNVKKKWNNYISTIYTTTHFTLLTNTTQNTYKPHRPSLAYDRIEKMEKNVILTKKEVALFDLINRSNLDGRSLELFFPLLIVGSLIGEDLVKEILNISKDITSQKRKDELLESDDVAFIDFISQKEVDMFEYVPVNGLTNEFREFLGVTDKEMEQINPRWAGRALKRLGLSINKKRVARGQGVILDVSKAKEMVRRNKGGEIK